MGTIENISKKYFIMDTSGNYYQLDQDGQLVLAEGKEDAVFFTYEEADQRIGNGRRAQFYRIVAADQGSTGTFGTIAGDGHVESHAEDAGDDENSPAKDEAGALTIREESCQDSGFADESAGYLSRWDMPELADLSDIDWLSYLCNFSYIVANIPSYREQLNQLHSRIDQTIGDLLHYVEIYDLDDARMREIMDEIKAAREFRRDIKNELARIGQFTSSIGTYNNASQAKEAVRMIQRSEACHYRPRVLKELFRDAPEEERRRVGCFSEMSMRYEEGHREDEHEDGGYPEVVYEEEGDTGQMDAERRETVYDGRDMDWDAFVKGQADFFRYAMQHVTNLQIDIRNIDALIEETLEACEDANYNVAQGYKMFRRLKELRNERKQLLVQMQKVQAITDRFDCDVMREIFEEIEEEYGLSGKCEAGGEGEMPAGGSALEEMDTVTSACMVSGVPKEQDGCGDNAGEDAQEVLQAV